MPDSPGPYRTAGEQLSTPTFEIPLEIANWLYGGITGRQMKIGTYNRDIRYRNPNTGQTESKWELEWSVDISLIENLIGISGHGMDKDFSKAVNDAWEEYLRKVVKNGR